MLALEPAGNYAVRHLCGTNKNCTSVVKNNSVSCILSQKLTGEFCIAVATTLLVISTDRFYNVSEPSPLTTCPPATTRCVVMCQNVAKGLLVSQ